VSFAVSSLTPEGGSDRTPLLAFPLDHIELRLTGAVPGESYTLYFDQVTAQGVTSAGGRTPPPTAEPPHPTVARINGLPTQPQIVLDGQPAPPVVARLAMPQADLLARVTGAGCRLLLLEASCAYDPYASVSDVWRGEGQFDYTGLDERLAAVRAAAPEARLILRVMVESPPWWDRLHPGELTGLLSPAGKPLSQAPPGVIGRKTTSASWASPAWQQDAAAALTRLIEHVQQAPYANAIIGYELAGGERGDWVCWGDSAGLPGDYSAPSALAFRRWLQQRYGSLADLRSGWGQPRMPVETPEAVQESPWLLRDWSQVQIPSPAERNLGRRFALLDPGVTRQVSDYQLFLSDLAVQFLADLVSAARQAAGPDKLIGAAYGGLLASYPAPASLQGSGQLALRQALGIGDLDFLTGPSLPPADSQQLVAPADTIRRSGKLWLPVCPGDPARAGLAERMLVAEGALQVNRLPEPDSTVLEAALQVAPEVTSRPHQPAEIALVVDDVSAAYLSADTDLTQALLCEQARLLERVGAPCMWCCSRSWRAACCRRIGSISSPMPLWWMRRRGRSSASLR
jgi:hypothetical protein